MGKDTLAWQLRAQRLTGPQSSFPVGQRNDFDWPKACLEMEQLIECWARQKDKAEQDEAVEAGQEGEAVANGEQDAADAERQSVPVVEEIRPEDEEGPERHGEEEEQENNVVIIREEGRENAADENEHHEERIEDEHLEQEDSGCVLMHFVEIRVFFITG